MTYSVRLDGLVPLLAVLGLIAGGTLAYQAALARDVKMAEMGFCWQADPSTRDSGVWAPCRCEGEAPDAR